MATSHAFTMLPPSEWEERLARNRKRYAEVRGTPAVEVAGFRRETMLDVEARYEHIRDAHDRLAEKFATARPTTLLIIGDDQNENLKADCLPQIAVYTGNSFRIRG